MKSICMTAIILCLCGLAVPALEDLSEHAELEALLPRAGDVDGWEPRGAPELAIEEELYIVIDGGADIYHEYGFRAALFQTYDADSGLSINLEIYEMESPEAAYGIYTFKTGEGGTALDVGCEGWFESYYLNFWEGKYLVTVIGLGTDGNVRDGLEKIARAVDAKRTIESKHPPLIAVLPEENLKPNGITYVKGNLGVFNRYRFAAEDVFGVSEGVIGRYDGFSVFVFQYENPETSRKWYDHAKSALKDSRRSERYRDRETHFEMSSPEGEGNELSIHHHLRWIIAVVAESGRDGNQVINALKARLTH